MLGDENSDSTFRTDATELTLSEKLRVIAVVLSWFSLGIALSIWGHTVVSVIFWVVTVVALFGCDCYLWWELWDDSES